MIELTGKYNHAKIYTDNVDSATMGQVMALLNQESMADSKIRIMPDCHAGAGCTIGTTLTITDKVVPNLVGVDIGCFTGDTPVWTGAGYNRIDELVGKENLLVDSWDEEQNGFITTNAVAKKTRTNAELVEVTYGSMWGQPIKVRCTPDHKFLVCTDKDKYYGDQELKWIEAANLQVDMRLVAEDSLIKVISVNPLQEREDVYCLTVEETHNFAIYGGIIVHNCGMHVTKLKETRLDLPKLDSVIRKNVPSGFDVREKEHRFCKNVRLEELRCKDKINLDRAYKSLGTLGGGNHFLEVDEDSEGNKYLVVHTGSRYLGKQVAEYYQEQAFKELQNDGREEALQAMIAELKATGRKKEIQKAVENFKWESKNKKVPKELSYCQGKLFDDYIHDMKIVQEFATWNREAIADVILKEMHLHAVEDGSFTTIHNYIDTDKMILRKGSVSAKEGEILLIPINMRDGSLLCKGKGNPDWNYSAPHGAGRLCSRSEAKDRFTVNEFKKTMKEAGIFTTSVGSSTLDECPMAYKPIDEIIENVDETVEILKIIKPIYNFKAGEQ